MPQPLLIHPVEGLPEFEPGMSIAAEIVRALDGCEQLSGLCDGDVLVVTSKIVSKVEDRFLPASEKAAALAAETVRVVAKLPGSGASAIVENRLGLVMAAAGIDESNVAGERLLLLPEDPDRSAARIAEELERLTGSIVGVIVSDTAGRAWRIGQTDMAIGAARVQVIDDVRGGVDANSKPLIVTQRCVGDELAAAADLVKGKASNLPVAVIRGLSQHVGARFVDGARSIVRAPEEDLFRMGANEAIAEGERRARAARDV
ncbi:coenzyme F420-0:L-glutamate ligase [Leucobacter luti]|uniref:Coenzyme F420-0:L-glutamate ligase/coenzyme F420-1:gamma-L-glutamate ligase n=1 Tax=Leucobacter luti TaxID=340320 RepID=A0A4Q7U0V1_9MICO|nr:coenzyme F420-0:L-glutamate ligase [Leucobacter luti]RZT67004.1 coenzyme F420-0:L-glutamate ligase/coenzyme F420-1:gamma-L-glutamate ligase [Leucobacter luti]